MTHEPWSSSAVRYDLVALADFVVVAELSHMTRASEVLGIPQSTLSRRVARLEAELGIPLLRRRGRRIEATREGAALAVTARRALQDIDGTVAELAEAHDASRGVVTLAFLHTLGPVAVPTILREFGRQHPGVRFRLVEEGHDEVVRRLRTGEVDVALTAPLPLDPDVVSVPLLDQALCVVVPTGHPLATRRSVTLSRLADEVFVGFKPGYGLRQITDEWCRETGFEPRLAFEGDDVATVRGLVAAGLGIALLPAADPAPRGDVVEVEVRRPRRSRTLGIATLAGQPLSPPARSFHDFLVERGATLLAAPPR
jgi:DNA-binding transcriptional LysR family regulator